MFDHSYRLAHLLLINCSHPLSITSVGFSDYVDGSYEKNRDSLIALIDKAVLFESPGFKTADEEFRSSSFSGKIGWDSVERPRDKLHATVIGGLVECGFRVMLSLCFN